MKATFTIEPDEIERILARHIKQKFPPITGINAVRFVVGTVDNEPSKKRLVRVEIDADDDWEDTFLIKTGPLADPPLGTREKQ